MTDPSLDDRLVALLDPKPETRARALRGLARDGVSLYAVRAVLLFDERAALRAKAARKLGRWRDGRWHLEVDSLRGKLRAAGAYLG